MDARIQQTFRSAKGRADTDHWLVKAFQSGDIGAFDGLVLNHQDRVFNLCLWFVGDYHEAHDTAQEVFIKAFRALHGFKGKSRFSTWLYRIAVNTCKSRLKSLEYRIKKRTQRLDPLPNSSDQEAAVDIADLSPSPLTALEEKERAALIQKAIHALPKEKKTVVILRDIQGLAYEEISIITGFSLGTVKSKLARARKELGETLRGVV